MSSLKITGEISRVSNRLAIRYELVGHLSEIVVPIPADMPVRKNALWEETCFEFFIAAKDSSRYREFNLSPAGHWNVFCFDAYRKGMQEDAAVISLPFNSHFSPGVLSLSLEIDLDRILPQRSGSGGWYQRRNQTRWRYDALLVAIPSRPAGRFSPPGRISHRIVR